MLNRLAFAKQRRYFGAVWPHSGMLSARLHDAIFPLGCENLEPELLRLGRTTFFYRDNIHKVHRVL